MSLARTHFGRTSLITLMFAAFGGSVWGANFVINGSFEQSTYSANHEFDVNGNFFSEGVTSWFGSGYSIYFFAGTQTSVSATGRFSGTGLEKLDLASTLLSPDGGNFIGMDGEPSVGSTVSTTVNGLTIGEHYNLTFYWAASQLQSASQVTNEQIQAQITNGATVDLNYSSAVVNTPSQGFTIDQATNNWFKVTLSFVASGSSEALTFFARSSSTGLPPFVLLDGVSVTVVPEPMTLTLLGLGTVLLFGVAAVRRRRSAK